MTTNTEVRVQCDMRDTCTAEVTHIGEKGYVYCQNHGEQRRGSGYESTRKMAAWERRWISEGRQLPSYRPGPEPKVSPNNTRRLIVTLPGVSDTQTEQLMAQVAYHVEECGVPDAGVMYVPDDADRIGFHTQVKVAPGVLDVTRVALLDGTGHVTHALEPGEARQLAGMLLRSADEAEGRA